LADLPASGERLTPWQSWTLLSLIRQYERQQWLFTIIKDRLLADPEQIAAKGAFGHPAVSHRGPVPGMPEWEYYFHGRGCCLTHRVTGESLDVDFFDDTADWIDRFFFKNFLESLTIPEPVEQRLLELHGAPEPVNLSIDSLIDLGLVVRHPQGNQIKLHPDCLELLPLIEQIHKAWPVKERRGVIAVSLSDWPLAEQCVDPMSSVGKVIAGRAAISCKAHFDDLESLYDSPDSQRLALQSIVSLAHPRATQFIRDALAEPPSGVTSAALEGIGDNPDVSWSDSLIDLLRRTNANGDAGYPEPYIWIGCARRLLAMGKHRDEVIAGMKAMQNQELAEVSLLALEFAPECAVAFFQRAMRSSVPINRIKAAAALAIIDQDWSRKLLIDVLDESDEQDATVECRFALTVSRNMAMREAVTAWERRNPHNSVADTFITMGEAYLRDIDPLMNFEMAELHDRVLPLRAVKVP